MNYPCIVVEQKQCLPAAEACMKDKKQEALMSKYV